MQCRGYRPRVTVENVTEFGSNQSPYESIGFGYFRTFVVLAEDDYHYGARGEPPMLVEGLARQATKDRAHGKRSNRD